MDAKETLKQIGAITLGAVGARKIRMMGDTLVFAISRGHRYVSIDLEPSDTYHVRTIMVRSGKTVFEQTGVYCDQLAQAVWDAHLERALNSHLASDPRYVTA